MFGEIDFLVVSSDKKKKRGTALIAFKDVNSALQAVKQTLGNADNRLEINFVGKLKPISDNSNIKIGPTPSFEPSSAPTKPAPASELPKAPSMSFTEHLAFEDEILKKMMAAAAKQKQ
jgi:hypothetical protein